MERLVNHDSGASFTGALATTASGTPNAGSYAITEGTLAGTGNYTIAAFNPGTLTVNKAGLTVSANRPTITYGSTVPALTSKLHPLTANRPPKRLVRPRTTNLGSAGIALPEIDYFSQAQGGTGL